MYIVIRVETVSLYNNSSVLLDTRDALGWAQNLANLSSAW